MHHGNCSLDVLILPCLVSLLRCRMPRTFLLSLGSIVALLDRRSAWITAEAEPFLDLCSISLGAGTQ